METITMNLKERNQLKQCALIKERAVTKAEAARRLGLSRQQLHTKYKRWLEHGDRGIIHRLRGKVSKRRWQKKNEAIAILMHEKYRGFGPTHATEKLVEVHGIKVSVETLRAAMIESGLWKAHAKKKPVYRQWRKPPDNFGDRLELDGVIADWLEERGNAPAGYNSVDSATGETSLFQLVPAESTRAIMQFLKDYIEKYGRPLSVYLDCHGAWRVNTNNPDGILKTQLERAMKELDIKVIHAKSPQAKGRIERRNGVFQDRLIKELRLAGISTVDEANKFITEVFLPAFNKKFTRRTHTTKDVHRSAEGFDLDKIFSIQAPRVVRNDFTLQYQTKNFQIEPDNRVIVRPKDTVIVHEYLDGSIKLYLRNKVLNYRELPSYSRRRSPVQEVIHDITTENLAQPEATFMPTIEEQERAFLVLDDPSWRVDNEVARPA